MCFATNFVCNHLKLNNCLHFYTTFVYKIITVVTTGKRFLHHLYKLKHTFMYGKLIIKHVLLGRDLSMNVTLAFSKHLHKNLSNNYANTFIINTRNIMKAIC